MTTDLIMRVNVRTTTTYTRVTRANGSNPVVVKGGYSPYLGLGNNV